MAQGLEPGGRTAPQTWMWSVAGRCDCAACGAAYQVMRTRIARRRYDYVRCEICDAVMDEWIDNQARRYLRTGEPVRPAGAADRIAEAG